LLLIQTILHSLLNIKFVYCQLKVRIKLTDKI
jgi:hypothetical protein